MCPFAMFNMVITKPMIEEMIPKMAMTSFGMLFNERMGSC